MVFIAHTRLELGPALSQSKHGTEAVQAGACLDTIGLKCRRAYTEVLTSFVDMVLKIGEKVRGSGGVVEDSVNCDCTEGHATTGICQSLAVNRVL
jgi:hypothetical protein